MCVCRHTLKENYSYNHVYYFRTFGSILFYEQEKIGITYLYSNVKVYK